AKCNVPALHPDRQWSGARKLDQSIEWRTCRHDHHRRLTGIINKVVRSFLIDQPAGGEEIINVGDSTNPTDGRHHVQSMLMRESLLDKDVQKSTETPVFRMLPEAHVVKVGGRSIIDAGKPLVYPLVQALARCLESKKLIIGAGGGVRSRHVFSIG